MAEFKYKLIRETSTVLLLILLFLFSINTIKAQQTEISGGLTQKSLLGQQRDFYSPALGYEFGFNHHINDYRLAHSFNFGFNFELFNLYKINSGESAANQYQQFMAPKGLFRYDYYINDRISVFSGGEVGFQFISLKSDQKVVVSSESNTDIFTKVTLSPQVGLNFEFNPNLAIYYKLAYDLGYYLGDQPQWGLQSSNWIHMLSNSAGLRVKINHGFY